MVLAWSGLHALCKYCKEREVKTGSWEFKEFSGEVEGLLGLKSFVWDSRAGYKVGAGF